MNEQTEEALKYSLIGITAVIIVALASNFLVPETDLGRKIRFAAPLLTGLIAGLWIHLEFRGNFMDEQ